MRTGVTFSLIACTSLAACSCGRAEKQETPKPTISESNATTVAGLKELSRNADHHAILDAVLHHVLTDARFEHSREFYGTAGNHNFALVSDQDYGVPWPVWYTPSVNNFQSTRIAGEDLSVQSDKPRLLGIRLEDGPRLLGIRLDKFNVGDMPKNADFRIMDGEIEITLMNVGGNPDGVIHIGGCHIFYDAIHDGEKWTVQFNGTFD